MEGDGTLRGGITVKKIWFSGGQKKCYWKPGDDIVFDGGIYEWTPGKTPGEMEEDKGL